MRDDVKKEIFQVIQDKTLSKQEKIQKIKDIYSSSNSGGVTGADTKDSGGTGHSNKSNDQSDDQNQNGQNNGQNNGQGNGADQQGQGQNDGQGQGQGQNSQSQVQNGQNNNGSNNVSHNQLKNQGVGQNGNQNGNQQNGNGSQGNQGNQSGQGGQNNQGSGSQGQQGNQSGNQGSNGGSQNSAGPQGNQQNGQGGSQSQNQQGGQQGQSGSQNGQGSGSQGQQGQGNQQQGQGNSQNQNQNGQQNQQNQQQGSQGGATKLDKYSIGYILGRKYAEELYKHRGLAPIMRDVVELPDNLDPMKILESLNESIDDDIASLLDDSNIDDDERTNKIHDLFRNPVKNNGSNQQNSEEKDIYVPDDVIIMRNGTVDPNSLLSGAHVIDEKIGDEIRKEVGVTPKDPDWGMSDSEDAMIKEAFPIIDDIFKHAPQDDKELVSAAETMKNKIEGRIRKSREGIIDWKKALQDFISERSHTYEKGSLRKNIYQRTGIGLRHRVKAFNDFNKCVVYIDTSGSVNNDTTQLIPIMAGEIGKIMQDCHFNTVDIHLFDDVVYDEHFDIDSYTVQDENWGIEGADDGGGTDIHDVYRHIIKTYMTDGELNYDVNAIIIITDVSGMQDSGNIKPFAAKLGKGVLERMLYVIYNDYQNIYLKDVTDEMDQLVSKYSQHYEISVEAFRKQILNESMNISQKRINMNEALGGLKGIQKKQQQGQIDPSQRTEDEKNERLRKSEIQGARAIGQLERVLPELVSNLEKFFPSCHMVKEYTAVMASEDTYYVTEEAHVILHMNIDGTNINNLCEACAVMNIDQLIGNVVLKNTRTFKGFPVGFPKEIGGDLIMFNLANLGSFANAPQAITGRVSINVCYPMNKHISKDAQNEYIGSLKKTLTPIDELENKPKRVFTMTRRNNESVTEIIKNRIALSESYINEMAMPKKLSTIFPRRSKPQAGSKVTEDDYIASTELYKKNRNVFFDVIDPLLNIGWGDISDDDVTVINDVSQIRLAAKDSKYFEKNKDNVNQLGYAGVRIFTTSDNIISAVYAQSKKGSKPTIVYLNDDNGDAITDPNKIKEEVDKRFDIFKQTYEYLKNVGVEPGNLPEKFSILQGRSQNATVEAAALHVLYYLMTMLNGTSGAVEYKFKPDAIISNQFKDGASDNKEIFSRILNYIYPDVISTDSVSAKVRALNGKVKVTVNFNQKEKNQPISKVNFNYAYVNSDSGHNVFECFSDNFLKALLIGSSLRGVDNEPRYSVDEIIDADRETLLEMINNVKDVELIKTSLKSLSFKGKDRDDKYDHSNPFDVLMMFPDKCEKEYDIRVDINDEALKLVKKTVIRDIYKAGMYSDIKNYKYNRETGERYRSDIKGTSSMKNVDTSEQFEEFDSIVNYIIDNKEIFKDAKKVIKDAIEKYTSNNNLHFNDDLISKFGQSIDNIIDFSNLIKTKVLNDPEIAKENDHIISLMINSMNDVIDFIDNIMNSNENQDYKSIIDNGYEIVKTTMKISELYTNLIDKSGSWRNVQGKQVSYQDIVSKKVTKLSDRNRSKKMSADDQPIDNSAKDEKIKSKYAQVVNNLSSEIVKVNNAVKNIDFAGASEDAVDHFATKEDMIRRIANQLNKVIEIANMIGTNGSIDWMTTTLPLLTDVFYTCNSIVNASNEESMTDFLVDLDGACRSVSKAVRGFADQQTYKQTGVTVA